VNAADRVAHEVTAADLAVSINGERSLSSFAWFAKTRVIRIVDREIRVDRGQELNFRFTIIPIRSLVGVDPQVNIAGKFTA
jgi:hypothetical protein